MDTPSAGQYLIRAGWDDVSHLTEQTKQTLLASYPPHQKEMRTKGILMLGHGRIYDLSEEYITCDSFDIPDHWMVIDGMDYGWDHPQAQVQLAIDMDTETVYVTHAWKQRHVSPDEAWGATKIWSSDVPTAWPADGHQTELMPPCIFYFKDLPKYQSFGMSSVFLIFLFTEPLVIHIVPYCELLIPLCLIELINPISLAISGEFGLFILDSVQNYLGRR
jgi:hypothetical protein